MNLKQLIKLATSRPQAPPRGEVFPVHRFVTSQVSVEIDAAHLYAPTLSDVFGCQVNPRSTRRFTSCAAGALAVAATVGAVAITDTPPATASSWSNLTAQKITEARAQAALMPTTKAVPVQVGIGYGQRLSPTKYSGCSIGFFGHNAAGQAFAVTAGHCDNKTGNPLYLSDGTNVSTTKLGTIVASQPDSTEAAGEPGFTLIKLEPNIVPHLAGKDFRLGGVGQAIVGKDGCLIGAFTSNCGPILDVAPHFIQVGMKVTQGDSGGPLLIQGPKNTLDIAGILVGVTERGTADFAPINLVINKIRATPIGRGFKIDVPPAQQ